MNTISSAKMEDNNSKIFYREILPLFVKHSLSRSIYVVTKFRVAELLEEGPMSAEAIASRIGCHADRLRRVLNFVATEGVFQHDGQGGFENTALSLQLRHGVSGEKIIADQDRHWKKLGHLSEEFVAALESKQEGDGEPLWNLARGYLLSRAIYAAAVLGIKNIYQQEPYASFLERGGFVRGGHLTPQGEVLREPGCREFFKHEIAERWHALGELETAVRTGQVPFTEMYGASFFDYLSERPEITKNFDKSMTFITECELQMLTPNLHKHLAPGTTVADIGGGHGRFLAGILEDLPDVSGILFDLPQTVEKHEIPFELQERITPCSGDFFSAVPAADAYVIKRVLHDWGDEDCVTILRRCRENRNPGAKLLINEFTLPHPIVAGIDINMMAVFNGRQRSLDEFSELCRKAGWQVKEVAAAAGGLTTIIAV